MREIKFRGIREKTGEWVYGYLVKREDPYLHDIVVPIGDNSSTTYAITRGTEGQYTGLKDKNGVEIYEGTIIKLGYKNGYIKYSQKQARYNVYFKEVRGLSEMNISYMKMESAEVIGNIY